MEAAIAELDVLTRIPERAKETPATAPGERRLVRIEVPVVERAVAPPERCRDDGARVAQIFVADLIPRVQAGGNHDSVSARIEHGEVRDRPILKALHERAEPSALPRVDLEEVKVPRGALHETVVDAVVRVVADVRRNAANPRPPLRLRLKERAEFRPPVASPRQVADLGVEVVAHLRVAAGDLPQVVHEVVEHPLRMIGPPARVRRAGRREVREQLRVRRHLQRRVHAVGPVVVVPAGGAARAFAVDEDRAEVRSAHLAQHADDAEIVGGRQETPGPLVEGRIGLHVQHPDVVAAGFAGQARAAEDVDRHARRAGRREADPPREKQVHLLRRTELEDRRVLEKERPLLREEQIEAREVHLFLIRFHLREVRIHREIGGEVRPHAPLHVEADVAVAKRVHLADHLIRHDGVIPVDRPERVGRDLEIAARRQIKPAQLRRRRHPVDVEPAAHGRHVHLLVLPADVALDVEAPGAVASGRVAQRLERYRDLGFPTALRDGALDAPIAVPVQVQRSNRPALRAARARRARGDRARLAFARHLAVVLDAERVGPEDERVLIVVEGVEHHDDGVGLREVGVAPALADDDLARFGVEADHADVEVRLVEQHAHFGAFARRRPFNRIGLRERRVRLNGQPRFVGDPSVDLKCRTIGQVPGCELSRLDGLRVRFARAAGGNRRGCQDR